jgi:hypothetical protein
MNKAKEAMLELLEVIGKQSSQIENLQKMFQSDSTTFNERIAEINMRLAVDADKSMQKAKQYA